MNRIALRLLLPLLLGGAVLSAQTIQVDKNNRTIAVTATDTASAEADIARVTVGFQVFAPDAAGAYQQGSKISNAVMNALKETGVPDGDIQSQQQQLSRTPFPFDDKTSPEERAQKQFTVSQSWIVRVPAKDAANVLHVAIEAGANESGNIDWDFSNREALQAQAAQKALVRARTIATQMAAGLDTHLGPLIYASNQVPERRIFPFAEMKGALGVPAQEPPTRPLAIRPGQVEESATVYAVFAIE